MVFPLLSGKKFIVTLQPFINTAPEVLKMSVLVCAVPVSVFAMLEISFINIHFSRCDAADGGVNFVGQVVPKLVINIAYLTPFHMISGVALWEYCRA